MSTLTPLACSVHTHSLWCDGQNTLEEMARAAWEQGVRHFGASGHSHTPVPSDEGNVLPRDPAGYCQEVLRLRRVYEGRMEVLLGIEQDSCAEAPMPDWADYWIGSVHHLPDPRRPGRYYAVDWNLDSLRAGCENLGGGDFLALAERYYAGVAAMARRRPTILGHIDLSVKLNRGGALMDENASRYRSAALEALSSADPRETLLEINTGAMARGYRDVPYPAQFLLRDWRDKGGRVILTADAHTAAGILHAYGEAADWARAAGFTRASVLTRAGETECPL